jgi:hypothetical protein
MLRSKQRLMGYVPDANQVEGPLKQVIPGEDVRGLVEQRAVGALAKPPSARELAKRSKNMKVKDWQVPSGPWVDEGIDLNERTLNKAKIVGVQKTPEGRQGLVLQPAVQARFEKLLQYAEENDIGRDWANGNWMESFATPQEALEFADHWAATSPRNQLSKNLTDAAAIERHRSEHEFDLCAGRRIGARVRRRQCRHHSQPAQAADRPCEGGQSGESNDGDGEWPLQTTEHKGRQANDRRRQQQRVEQV